LAKTPPPVNDTSSTGWTPVGAESGQLGSVQQFESAAAASTPVDSLKQLSVFRPKGTPSFQLTAANTDIPAASSYQTTDTTATAKFGASAPDSQSDDLKPAFQLPTAQAGQPAPAFQLGSNTPPPPQPALQFGSTADNTPNPGPVSAAAFGSADTSLATFGPTTTTRATGQQQPQQNPPAAGQPSVTFGASHTAPDTPPSFGATSSGSFQQQQPVAFGAAPDAPPTFNAANSGGNDTPAAASYQKVTLLLWMKRA
jgi:hypothetical protein